jgi:hypothetical protein
MAVTFEETQMNPLFIPRASLNPHLNRTAVSPDAMNFAAVLLNDPAGWGPGGKERAESLSARVPADAKRAIMDEMILAVHYEADAADYYDRIFFLAQDPDLTDAHRKNALRCMIRSRRACKADVEAVLTKGFDSNKLDRLLFHAAFAGNIDILKTLIDHGADINGRGKCTTLAAFILNRKLSKEDLATIDFLLDGTDLLQRDEEGYDVLGIAVKHAQGYKVRVVKMILQAGSTCNQNGMMRSIEKAKKLASIELINLKHSYADLASTQQDARNRFYGRILLEAPTPEGSAHTLARLEKMDMILQRNDAYVRDLSAIVDILDKERENRQSNVYL